jgi:hypothetical protein
MEDKQYRSLAAHCKEPFTRTMLALGYTYGFRKGELLGVKVRNVELLGGTVGIDTSRPEYSRTFCDRERAGSRGAKATACRSNPCDGSILPHRTVGKKAQQQQDQPQQAQQQDPNQ